MSNPIRQKVTFSASPDNVYRTYMKAESHAAFTGRPAEIRNELGSAFSVHGGMVTGRNIELANGRMIVQAWRSADWEDGVYSIVRIELQEDGDGTELRLHHDAFPDGAREHLDAGWGKMYWEPMQKYLSESA